MLRVIVALVQKYERHLSALAMVGGFVTDNIFFSRIDLSQTQALFALYAAVCFISIPSLHSLETRRARRGAALPAWRFVFPLATQFALGGFWSAFVIFYGRSAVLGASWPFMLLVVLAFIGNEYFYRHHGRLVFTSILFFFALYSLMIFEMPVYTGAMGTWTFLLSGLVAVGIFALFTMLLRIVARERFLADVRRIRVGAFVILVLMNVFYFTNILPPLPLSAPATGIYHAVWRVQGAYLATSETAGESWLARYLGFAPTIHVVRGESLFAYASVFAPTALATTVVHRWERYDEAAGQWVQKATIAYPIIGGRDGGYRGYSDMPISEMGKWRVSVETSDGRVIARLPFTAEAVALPPLTETITLR